MGKDNTVKTCKMFVFKRGELNDAIDLINQDFKEWTIWLGLPYRFSSFLKLLLRYKEFRCLVHYRFSYRKTVLTSILKFITGLLCPSMNLYFCNANIKGGLRLMHGFSTIINAKSIGNCCVISQQVTIGWAESGLPTIGDYCKVYSGAKILGGKNRR